MSRKKLWFNLEHFLEFPKLYILNERCLSKFRLDRFWQQNLTEILVVQAIDFTHFLQLWRATTYGYLSTYVYVCICV